MRRSQSILSILACALSLGVAPTSGGAAEPITLGAAVSQTGKYALNGANTKNGYDLAAKVVNEKGGIEIGGTRHDLHIRYYDDESTPARGTELAERLIQQDHVKFILGPYGSGLTKAMLPIVEKHGVPMVEGNGAARELFTKGYRHIFAVLSTSDQYLSSAIDLVAEHAKQLGKEPKDITVALAMENDPFGQDVRAGVLDDIDKHGMQVVIDDQLPPELNDMSVTLAKVKALRPDVLVVSGHEKGALTAVTQLKALHVDVPVLAMTHCDSAKLAETLPDASEYAFCAQQWHASLDYQGSMVRLGRGLCRAVQGDLWRGPALPGSAIRRRRPRLCRCPGTSAEPRSREGARCARRDRSRDLFRPDQIRRNRAEPRQAHGADPDPQRQI